MGLITKPAVTVLIPCNDTQYLAQCLASIEKQDYSKLDILVVLNGPAFKLSKQLQIDFSSMSRPVVFLSTPLDGIVNALNFGLQNCENELVARIDADDLMPISRISSQVLEFQKDSKLVCVGGQLEYLAYDGHPRHPGYPQRYEEISHALHRYSSLPHPGVMYKKSALEKIGNYRDDYPFIEDWNLWVRLSQVGKIINLPTTTLIYRVHANQITERNAFTQHRSIVTFSSSRLQECLQNPNLLDLRNYSPDLIDLFQKMISLLLAEVKPVHKTGVLGRKELRRRLAGYVYCQFKYEIDLKRKLSFRNFILSITSILIDPKIFIVYIKNIMQKTLRVFNFPSFQANCRSI